VDPRAKQRSRLHWWLAEQEAKKIEPGAIALLLDLENHVTETAGANFLLVRAGTVVSPPRSTILNGISLQVIQELCGELGIPFEEKPFHIAECLAADEAMLTSTPYCVAGVSRINGTPLKTWPGPVFQKIQHAWCQKVGVDIARQILANR
jgi:branched-subunit amino acid aminotransferase/4-amino-4-deoxychorismate lyase